MNFLEKLGMDKIKKLLLVLLLLCLHIVINAQNLVDTLLHNKNVILGLTAKGDAKKDKSGFVIDGYNLN